MLDIGGGGGGGGNVVERLGGPELKRMDRVDPIALALAGVVG